MAEELLARRTAEKLSGRIDIRSYEWFSVQHTKPGTIMKLPFHHDSESKIPVTAVSKRHVLQPKLKSQTKMIVSASGTGRSQRGGQVEGGDYGGSWGAQPMDKALTVPQDSFQHIPAVNEVEVPPQKPLSLSPLDQRTQKDSIDSLEEAKEYSKRRLLDTKPMEVDGIKIKTSTDAVIDATSDPMVPDLQYQVNSCTQPTNFPPSIAEEIRYTPGVLHHDEELYQALKVVRGTSLKWRPETQLELEQRPVSRNIHILGMGSVGKFIAHSLAGLKNPPPITLLMHRPLLMQQWHEEGGAITLLKKGRAHSQSDFNIECSADFQRESPHQRFAGFGKNLEHTAEPPNTVIDTLIVTTDANVTASALLTVKSRLRRSSTICFVQYGMGIVEKINATIFPDPHRRPTYILGSISHKLASTGRTFTIIEHGSGSLVCSKLPQRHTSEPERNSPLIRRSDFSWSPQATNLVETLARVPELNTKTLGHKSFYRIHLENVAVNAVIGSLSVVFDCSNDQLLFNYSATQTMRSILTEISLVLRSLPELRIFYDINKHFSAEKLEAIVVSTIRRSGKNLTSMLQDTRAGKRTNIEFYNGYLVNRGAELGIRCPVNEMIINMVKAKQMMKKREADSHVPFRDRY